MLPDLEDYSDGERGRPDVRGEPHLLVVAGITVCGTVIIPHCDTDTGSLTSELRVDQSRRNMSSPGESVVGTYRDGEIHTSLQAIRWFGYMAHNYVESGSQKKRGVGMVLAAVWSMPERRVRLQKELTSM